MAYTSPEYSAIALLTIDVQRGFLDGQAASIPGTSAMLPELAAVVDVPGYTQTRMGDVQATLGRILRTAHESHLRSLGVTSLAVAGCNFPNCPRPDRDDVHAGLLLLLLAYRKRSILL
jgi:hypothetical protein